MRPAKLEAALGRGEGHLGMMGHAPCHAPCTHHATHQARATQEHTLTRLASPASCGSRGACPAALTAYGYNLKVAASVAYGHLRSARRPVHVPQLHGVARAGGEQAFVREHLQSVHLVLRRSLERSG